GSSMSRRTSDTGDRASRNRRVVSRSSCWSSLESYRMRYPSPSTSTAPPATSRSTSSSPYPSSDRISRGCSPMRDARSAGRSGYRPGDVERDPPKRGLPTGNELDHHAARLTLTRGRGGARIEREWLLADDLMGVEVA